MYVSAFFCLELASLVYVNAMVYFMIECGVESAMHEVLIRFCLIGLSTIQSHCQVCGIHLISVCEACVAQTRLIRCNFS